MKLRLIQFAVFAGATVLGIYLCNQQTIASVAFNYTGTSTAYSGAGTSSGTAS